VSCVLVERNRRWFDDNIDELANLWKTIETERKSGYEHRAPNRRSTNTSGSTNTNKPSGGCLLKINKETGQAGLMTKQDHVIKVFKVRTESFDEVKEKDYFVVFDHNV
jgi:hypothetical protein